MSVKYITNKNEVDLSLYNDVTHKIDRRKSKIKNIKKVYILLDATDNPKQSKDITYKYKTCTFSSWEGAMPDSLMGWASMHPYGEVCVLLKK